MILEYQRLYSDEYRSVIPWRIGKGHMRRGHILRPPAGALFPGSREDRHISDLATSHPGERESMSWSLALPLPLTPSWPLALLDSSSLHPYFLLANNWSIVVSCGELFSSKTGSFKGPLKGNDHNKHVLLGKQKSKWKAQPKFQRTHPAHILKLGQKGRYFVGFYFIWKGRFEGEGEGVKCSQSVFSVL